MTSVVPINKRQRQLWRDGYAFLARINDGADLWCVHVGEWVVSATKARTRPFRTETVTNRYTIDDVVIG